MKLADLSQLSSESNSHNPKITKKVLIKNKQIPHLTNFTQAIFPPSELASIHSHVDMYEIFFIEKGEGVMKVNDKTYHLKAGVCVTIEPGDTHEFINNSKQDLIITYLGITI